MKQYLDILSRVLSEGKEKFPTRFENGKHVPVDGGVKTFALPNVVFSHNMQDGFPLLTTKKMAWKTMAVELEGFIAGITEKKWYQERGCRIWNEWCNPQVLRDKIPFEDTGSNPPVKPVSKKELQKRENDLGPIYGYQWRNFGRHYETDDSNWCDTYKEDPNGTCEGVDQLKAIVDKLHNSPYDRRMVCSSWNPNQANQMALVPCHWGWNITVIGDELHMMWVQRSCDLLLGVPFNIASYALLQTLLCIEGGFFAGNLTGVLVDCHLYENQLEIARQQLEREPRELPKCIISWPDNRKFDIFKWTHKDLQFDNYNPHPKLDKVQVVV